MIQNDEPIVGEATPASSSSRFDVRKAALLGVGALVCLAVGAIGGRLFPPFVLDEGFWRDFVTSAGFGGVAALAAAAIAFGAAWYTSHRSTLNAAADRRQRDIAAEDDRLQREVADQRAQWWARFTWATERALDPRHRNVGLVSMIGLVGHPWASPEDTDIADAVADVLDKLDTGTPDGGAEGGER